MVNLKKHFYFLPLILSLAVMLAAPQESWAQRRERYKSRGSNTEEYSHKNREERKDFDRNFGRYQNLSPSQKREKMDKWREFKQNTTPAERDFILNKMRDNRQRRNLDQ